MIPGSVLGEIAVLNVGAGDLKVEFDPERPSDVQKARRVIEDMLRRGYVILAVLEGGKLRRIREFDPARCVYVVDMLPGDDEPAETKTAAPEPEAAPARAQAEASEHGEGETAEPQPEQRRGRGRPKKTREVAAGTTRAVSVPRTAGG